MLKAVLFDLDQTLIDWETAENWEDYQGRRLRTVRDFVHEQLHPLPNVDAVAFFSAYITALTKTWAESNETLVAPNIKLILGEVLRSFEVPVETLDLEAVVRAYDWGPAEGERVYPDVVDVLPELEARGVALGIVTNASHPMVYRDRELHATGIIDHFPHCRVAAVDIGVIKPHRRIFEHALEKLGAQPDEAVFVGDNLRADIHGAQGVGMYAVWRKGPDGDAQMAEHGQDIVPDGTITTLHDLLPLLDGWYPGWRNGSTP